MNYKATKRILLDELGWVKPGELIEVSEDMYGIQDLISTGSLLPLEEAVPTSKQQPQEVMTKTPWIYDPEDLEGYDLDTLNALIAEADSTVEPYETLEEAISHLSMDHAEWQRLSK